MVETTKRHVCFGWDAFIILFVSVLAIFVWWRGFDYLSGVTNRAIEKGIPFGVLLLYALVGLLLLSCIVLMIARIAYQWKAIPIWGNFVRCAIIPFMCAGTIVAFFHPVAGIEKFAQGFEVKMRSTANVKAIRAWASCLVVPADGGTVPEHLWSGCVTVLSPKEVSFDKDAKGVKLHWGGGFLGDYGLVVGAEDVLQPQTNELESIVPLEAGAYLYFPRR